VPEELFSHQWEEHDAFALFEALMEAVGPWYLTGHQMAPTTEGEERPWSRPQVGFTNSICCI
jgi:hypothetical protein